MIGTLRIVSAWWGRLIMGADTIPAIVDDPDSDKSVCATSRSASTRRGGADCPAGVSHPFVSVRAEKV